MFPLPSINGWSVVPVKQNAEAADPHEFCTAAVKVGELNLLWPSRKYAKRNSFTEVVPIVQVCVTFTCCVRVLNSPGKLPRFPPACWNLANGSVVLSSSK